MKGITGYRETDWWIFWTATSPADFWSKWNPGLHNGYLWFLKSVRKITGLRAIVVPTMLFIFLFNGIWHDVIITRLILGGTGFPVSIFFLLQFFAVVIERTLKLKAGFLPAIFRTLLTYGWLVVSFLIANVISSRLF